MNLIEIGKGFGKFVAWLVGIVTAPYLIALALSAILALDFAIIIQYVVILYVAMFLIVVIYYSLKRYIREEVYKILKNEKLIEKNKEGGNEK